MKKRAKLIAVLMSVIIIFSSLTFSSEAGVITEKVTATKESRHAFGERIDRIIQTVVKGVCSVYPEPRDRKNLSEYTGENVYADGDGRKGYESAPAEGAKWRLGYASASIIPDDFAKNKYYMGRQLNVVSFTDAAKCDGVLDDQRVRVACLDDSSGRGAVVFAVIDGLGVTSATIRTIRSRLADYVKDGRIAAVNVSATHTHSAIDTQGVSTSMLYVMLANTFTNIFGLRRARTPNDPFIENLIDVTVAQIEKAYAGMTEGTLLYDSVDITGCTRDKRGYVVGGDLPGAGVLRFEPDDSSRRGVYLVNMTCHPTNVNAGCGLVSADYPYYMDRSFDKAGYDFLMFQGAVGQITGNGGDIKNTGDYNKLCEEYGYEEKYGKEFFDKLGVASADAFAEKVTEIILGAAQDGEEELPAVINTNYNYVEFVAGNQTLQLACKIRLVDNEVYKRSNKSGDAVLPTEIGCVELGGRMALGLFPCELYPEVFHGMEVITDPNDNYSWDGSDWPFPAARAMMKRDVDVYAVSFANDYIGYVVPDNFYSGWGHWALKGSDRADFEYDPSASIFSYAFAGTADEILSADKSNASKIMTVFRETVSEMEAY